MRVHGWLLCVFCFHSCIGFSQRCRFHNICQTERSVLDGGSKGRVKEHVRHSVGHQEAPHRNRPHRRKGTRAQTEDIAPSIVHQPSDVVAKLGNPATLSCRVDGSPKPTIEWLRNGQPLGTEMGAGPGQPLVLSEGSLFFLRVGGGKRGQSHEGVYACVARNSAGVAISRNASLFIAVLKDEFRAEPSDVEAAEGEAAVLNCEPPLGRPEPNVLWKKDGIPINNTDPHYTKLSGKLIVEPAEKSHSGSYVCEARNIMGVRQSRPARLSVLAKPAFVLRPENVSVRTGESAHFHCQAKGDPPPAVAWSRDRSPLPNGRYLINPDQTLQLHYVTAQDAGLYTCTAANHVGVVRATATLQVQEAPRSEQRDFHRELSALRVALDNVAMAASGSNMSLVQWKLQNFPAQPHYLDGFEVLYRSLLPASSDWAGKKVSLPSFQTQVGPLKRGYKYEFKVRPYGSSLFGRESNTRHLRVPEKVPSAPPQAVSITVDHEKNNSIRLSWEPPPHDSHNGVLQGYQVWCVDSEEQQHQNWTVDSSQHSLDISSLKPDKQYWITMAAVNGAGVGALSDPHGFFINPQLGAAAHWDRKPALALLQEPEFIGSVGALLWCLLMIAAVVLFRCRSSRGRLLAQHGKAKGLRRLASEDLIIKHRMAVPDSPWISGSWRPPFSQKYQDLWAQGSNHPGLRSTSLPVSSKQDGGILDSAVPIVTDSCGVYGTFYVDLQGRGLKTFSSPGRCPKMPHAPPDQQGAETIQISSQPSSKSSSLSGQEALPWKQAIRPQPKMGVLRESWEKRNCGKQELHAVNSVPVLSSRKQAWPSTFCTQRLSHIPAGRHGGAADCGEAAAGSRLLHYSASLHLVDLLPPPPPTATERNTLSSDEGSSESTKLTEDMGSIPSISPSSGYRGQAGDIRSSSSHPSTPSYSTLMENDQSASLTAKEATEYLELSPKPERYSVLPSLPLSFSSTLGSTCGPVSSADLEDEEAPAGTPSLQAMLHRPRFQTSPSSCYSDWDSSLWNTWSSAMDSNRTSLISSVDSCYTNDSSTFAHLLAVAAERSGASLSDFSPPASPLSALYPSLCPDGDAFRDLEAVPAWDWSMAWLEEMDAQYRAHYPSRSTRPSNT
ncbi:roundabout homolog 1 isoform X2 [Cyprinodon tularosa]|uniref:roundabout homolog 1 isoform X2 n=1 Tax=Cyprinodon tularosa TaxID=77115 RepID=UPI0018E24B58|nr:roundabout homolog 1 isoform X2 [Cyprinodon tularosa]